MSRLAASAASLCLALLAPATRPGRSAGPAPSSAFPIQRMTVEDARRNVQALSDFYRESLLDLHVTYVTDGKPPSATVIKKVFAAMTARGWPAARWLSINGHPLNPDNVPRDRWELEAGRQVRHGVKLVDHVESGRYRAVVEVPFTGPCLKCHWGEQEADYRGAISFTVPLVTARATRTETHQ